MRNNTQRITGGIKGFAAAITEAYYGAGEQMHSPCIRYSHARGFHVEPKTEPEDDDVIWQSQCGIHADTGRKFHIVADYPGTRAEILAAE